MGTTPHPIPLHPATRCIADAVTGGRMRYSRNPSTDGFLCSSEHSKVSFELLKGFRVTPKRHLALAGGWLFLRSRTAHLEPAVGIKAVAYVANH